METTEENIVSNLNLADDILLTASTLPQLSKLLAGLTTGVRRSGLQIHPEKTTNLKMHVTRIRKQETWLQRSFATTG